MYAEQIGILSENRNVWDPANANPANPLTVTFILHICILIKHLYHTTAFVYLLLVATRSMDGDGKWNFFNFVQGKSCAKYHRIHRRNLGGGGGGGHAGARPLQDPILSFLITFSLKSTHVGGQNPPKWVHAPLRKILDPALVYYRSPFQIYQATRK